MDRYHPAVVGIVDGEFGQSLSVWHKEILHVLGRRVRVLAPPLGALRAAECDVYGMEGVGRIYEWFRDEVLNADDEVALLHGSAEDGWRGLSWPMVNIRATVDRLRADGVIDEVAADAVLDVATSLYFGSRTERALASELTASGRLDGAGVAALVTAHYVDQKRLDANELLALLAGDLDPAPGEQRAPRQRLSWLGETLRTCDTEVHRPTGAILRYRIVRDAALHETDFEQLQERALNRMVVSLYAEELGFHPTDDEVTAERAIFLRRRQLDEDTLAGWLAVNDLDDERFAELLLDEVRVRRMQRWYLGTLGYERNCGPVTDQLRIEGRYPDVADRAAVAPRWQTRRTWVSPPMKTSASASSPSRWRRRGGGRRRRSPTGSSTTASRGAPSSSSRSATPPPPGEKLGDASTCSSSRRSRRSSETSRDTGSDRRHRSRCCHRHPVLS